LTLVQRNQQTVATYVYNAMGERIAKAVTSPQVINERFVYSGMSQLVGEYGTTNRDYIWLGDLPVAVVDDAIASSVNYVYADGLGTPRAVSDSTGSTVWQWVYKSNPFGEQQPTGSYIYNLRFPGQYYDVESGLYYNVNRYQEPGTGRYIQSDQLGLAGGLSTYGYVGARPLTSVDELGLQAVLAPPPVTPEPAPEEVASLNTPATQAAIESIEAEAREEARQRRLESAEANGTQPGVRVPLSQYGEFGACKATDFDPAPTVGPPGRLPRDMAVNPAAPDALGLNRPIGSSPSQNARVQQDIADAQAQGATDFRVNQQQVNADGTRVGTNRPDLQYTDANGQRTYIEYDTDASNRGAGHQARISANDPSGQVILIRQN
jgi:RHS repeat-associated protein